MIERSGSDLAEPDQEPATPAEAPEPHAPPDGARDAAASFGEAAIPRADRGQRIPASDAQLGIWFFEIVRDSGPPTYHIPTLVDLKGPLEPALLERAIEAVVARHEILRCGVAEAGGEAFLAIRPAMPVARSQAVIAEADVAAAVAELATVPFDLAQGPLVRWHLLQVGPDDHRLVILQHHLIGDGWSVGLLVRELLETYARLVGGADAPRPAPALQYADVAAYARHLAETEPPVEALDYWRETLADVPVLELPTDTPRPSRLSGRGRHHQFRLPAELVAAVRGYAQRARVTPFAVLFTAHALMIARYAGQTHFAVTMPVHGRTRPEYAEMLGCFVNLLPIRCRIDPAQDFAGHVDRAFDALMDAATFQEAPFHRIAAALGTGGEPREALLGKIFRSLFVLDSANRDLRIEAAGLLANVTVEAPHDVAKTDLAFALQEDDDGVAVRIEFARELFEPATIARMAGHFERLLAAALATPDRPVGRLPMLSPEEFLNVAVTANETSVPFPRETSLAELLEDVAARCAGMPVYVDGDVTLTFAALDRRANALAAALIATGVAPGDHVSMLLDRGPDAVVAIVATIKAGAAYVPIEPEFPEERATLILRDAGVRVLIVDPAKPYRLPPDHGCSLVSVDTGETEERPRLARRRRADDPAYVYYTSGTTGRPRGAIIPDRGVVRLFHGTDFYNYRPGTRIGFQASLVFDATTLEVWSALLHGGCLVYVSKEALLDVDLLQDLIERERIDVLWLTAPLFHRVAEERPEAFGSMDLVMTGGAVVDPAAVRRVLSSRRPPGGVLNGYGPTETTVFTNTQTFRPGEEIELTRPLPMGRPIANTRLYIVDANDELVPKGVPGELLVAGDGLAIGYLNRPDLNATRFVTMTFRHPELPGPGREITERVYRTGDTVKRRSDGLLEFVGRVDRQIKLRGFRVELGEIEAAMLAHPNITEAIVVPRGADADLRLDAYYVGGDEAPPVDEVRAWLAQRLPAYMAPQRYRCVAQMPLNTSGKIDVARLPATAEPARLAPGAGAGASAGAGERLDSRVERELAAIVADVLECAVPDPDHDFFALGGDSIQSIRVAGRARDRGLALTVRDIFEQRTIARMAAALEERSPSLKRVAGEAGARFALTPIQRWFFGLALPAPDHVNLAMLLKTGGRLDPQRLERAVARLIEAQEALRSRWPADPASGGDSVQEVLPKARCGEIAVHVHRLGDAAADGDGGGDGGGSLGVVAEIDRICSAWQSGLDVAAGPVLAVGILQNHPDGCDRLFIAVHHLAVDVVSLWILLDQLHRLYVEDDAATGIGDAPGTLALWSQALASHAGAETTRAELDHWRDAVSGPRHFEDAAGVPSPSQPVRLERELRIDATAFDAAAIALERLLGMRAHETLFVAATLALASETDARDVTVAVEGHGREQSLVNADISRTIGWFTTLYPCRIRLPAMGEDAGEGEGAGEGASDALVAAAAAIKDAFRSAPGNGIGFGLLRYLSRDPVAAAALSAWTRADLAVNYLGGLDLAAGDWRLEDDAPGATVSPENPPPHALDLTAFKAGGELVLSLIADGRAVPAAVADSFCARVAEAMQRLAALAGSDDTPRLVTASDHPLAGLSRDELVRVLGPHEVPGRKALRLTPVEEGILFEALAHPDSNAYTIQIRWQHQGELDPGRLKRAFEWIVARYESLRSHYVVRDLPHPIRIVEPSAEIGWRLLDWRGMDPARQEAERATLLADDRRRAFDLRAPDGLRVVVARRDEAVWEILWTIHHIYFDGWSVSILLTDVADAYDRLAEPGAAEPAPPPSFDAFLEHRLKMPPAPGLAFWAEQLAGFEAPVELPFRVPGKRLNEPGPDGASVRIHVPIPVSLAHDVETLSANHAVTQSTAFQYAWGLLLARCARTDDVVIGTTVSGRAAPVANVENMVGLAISTVPVRIRVDDTASAIDGIRALHATLAGVEEHSHLPITELQKLSAVGENERLFHGLFVFENYPWHRLAAGGTLRFDSLEMLDKTEMPLTILVILKDRPRFEVAFDPTLYTKEGVERLCRHLQALLRQIADDPARAVGTLDVTLPAERRTILGNWNATRRDIDLDRTVLDLVAEQAAETPNATAVKHREDTLSYAGLEAASARLALRIRRRYRVLNGREMPAETVVALITERGLPMIVSMLAAMKAGGAYLPIDTSDPAHRMAYLVEDASAALILADTATSERLGLAARFGDRLLAADDWSAESAADPAAREDDGDAPLPAIRADQLAYVMYTSGSTGRPKGTLIEHRGIVNRLAWVQSEYYALTPADRVLQKTPYTFDVSGWELYWPLVEGARLVFADPGGHRDPAYLHRVIKDEAITVVHFVPSMLQVFLEHPGLETLTSLRLVAASGEGLPTRLSARVLSALPQVMMLNLYGPTEATIEVSGHVCSLDDERIGPMTPIGRPAWNTTLHVLDPAGRLLPPGVPGELHLGGVQLARGYLNRPDLTAERFVENGFGLGRLYRTGDLVSYRSDGVIDYLGRIDFQLKIRGMRVEPGEIEAAIETVPGVGQACVLVEEGGETPSLAAFFTGAESLSGEAIAAHLAEELPAHMVPARIVRIDGFPLTSSGKVDRKALRELAPADTAAGGAAAAPAAGPLSEMETLVFEIYGSVLKAGAAVEPDKSFFALGGHSLTAMRAAMRLSERLGVEVPVRLIFEHSSVRALAAELGRLVGTGTAVATLTPADRSQALRPSHAQARVLFLEQFAEVPSLYLIPAALRVRGPFDADAFVRAAERLVATHEILRTRYAFRDDDLEMIVDPPGRVDFAARDIGEKDLEDALQTEANTGFALDREPPVRFRLFRLAPDDHVVVVHLHHAVTDAWSLRIVLSELARTYEVEVRGLAAPVKRPALGYIDFAVWQRTAAAGDGMRGEIDYWRERLADAPVLEFPTDRPRPPVASYRGATGTFTLDKSDTEALERFCRERKTTLFPVLLAAWSLVLSRYSEQDDIVVGAPVANRPLAETEEMVGLFQNMVPLRIGLDEDEMLAAFVGRVARQVTEDFARQDLPFQLMIEALDLPRDPSRAPLFQAMLILDDGDPGESPFAPQGLEVTPITLGSDTSKVDLTAAFSVGAEGLVGTFEYASDLFEPRTIARLGAHLSEALRSFVSDPLQRVGDVEVVSQEERADLLERFNATTRQVDFSKTVLDQIAATAGERPQEIAVVDAQRSLTYAELEEAASRLARRIRRRYAELHGREMLREAAVALVLERSVEMIVAILAVMKAGGAYLPISPADPPERVAFMLEDAAVGLVLAHGPTLASPALSACPNAQVMGADEAAAAEEDDAADDGNAALPRVAPGDLAYIIYTSGSTGRPKGTMIEHRSLTNRMAWVEGEFALSPGDRVLQKTANTFDVSISELIWPLCAGARLIFAGPDEHRDPAALHRLIEQHRITVLHFVPSMLQPFADYPGLERLTSLRLVLVIGEPLLAKLATSVVRALPAARVVNLYGPTEATIDVSFHDCSADDEKDGAVVAIGRPGWNTALHVLDRHGRLAPLGVPGELAIGGPQVARGYLNRPELTSERFVRNPFGGGRLYLTGDRVRRRDDGVLDTLGRIDFQVKIRGMRVELGEIESRLEACLGVAAACVVTAGEGGDTALIGCVSGAAAPSEAEIRATLASALPDYMVPERIVRLDAFPTTTSGKVDRKRLLEIADADRSAAAAEAAAGRPAASPSAAADGATEQALAAIWRDFLGHDAFCATDGFFDVGGTSLGAMRLVSRIAKDLGRTVPIVAIFRHPTVRDLAAHLDRAGGEPGAARSAVPRTHHLEEARARADARRARGARRR